MNEGNKNAEKWTEETVMVRINQMMDFITEDKHKEVASCKFLTLGSLLYECDLYGEIWSYWKEKFKDNKTVFQSIKRIDAFFENRLHEGALGGKLNPAVSIFSLKNNYKWTDQKQVDITTKGDSLFKDKTDQQLIDEHKRLSSLSDTEGDIKAEG